jgi:Holliday junction resolvase-like predicted endonuclease
MQSIMICLIGEQPIPNLLPIRYLKPTEVALVYTKTSESVKQNLAEILNESCQIHEKEVPPYNLADVKIELEELLIEKGWNSSSNFTFNLTGGTKPMSLAAFRLAEQLRAKFVYFQSEGGKSLLYTYNFLNNEPILEKREEIDVNITIDDYLKAHGLDYNRKEINEQFEELVFKSLQPSVCEIIRGVRVKSLDIDLVIRCGNQVGIAEVKTGRKAEKKEGIDQLSTASQREFLGTYTKRFLILSRKLGTDNRLLAEARNIRVIELLDDHVNGLSENDKKHLVTEISNALNCKS